MAKEKTKERKKRSKRKERKVKRKQDGVIFITHLKTARAHVRRKLPCACSFSEAGTAAAEIVGGGSAENWPFAGPVPRNSRIIVATEEQYPYSLEHVHGLLDSQYPSGSFSSDNKIYSYALCTSVFLRGVVDGVIQPHQSGVDCFFFSI